MKILSNYSDPFPIKALTIGNFDGLHLGHQAIIKRLTQQPHSALFTFSNHPNQVLHQLPTPYLTTLSHRLALFEEMGVDVVILIPFTKLFAQQSARAFLTILKQTLGFTHLILGHDSLIGHDQNRDLRPLSQELGFHVEYLEPVQMNGTIISSSAIREHIRLGQFKEASLLLGRPYSIQATVRPGKGIGGLLGFHTANLPVEELILPPLGVYVIEVRLGEEILPAVANLGHAPTIHQERPIQLEVHLLNQQRHLYDQLLDVRFITYLRPEKKFDSKEALYKQIESDVTLAKNHLNKR